MNSSSILDDVAPSDVIIKAKRSMSKGRRRRGKSRGRRSGKRRRSGRRSRGRKASKRARFTGPLNSREPLDSNQEQNYKATEAASDESIESSVDGVDNTSSNCS